MILLKIIHYFMKVNKRNTTAVAFANKQKQVLKFKLQYYYSEYDYNDNTFGMFVLKQKIHKMKRRNNRNNYTCSNAIEVYNFYKKYVEYCKQQQLEEKIVEQIVPIEKSSASSLSSSLSVKFNKENLEKNIIFEQTELTTELDSIKSVFEEYTSSKENNQKQETFDDNHMLTEQIQSNYNNNNDDYNNRLQELLLPEEFVNPFDINNDDEKLFFHNPNNLITFADKILYSMFTDYMFIKCKRDALETDFMMDYFNNFLILLVDYSNNQQKYLISYKFSQKRLTCKKCGDNYHKMACCDKHKHKILLHSKDEKEIEFIISTLKNKYYSKNEKKLMCLLFINDDISSS